VIFSLFNYLNLGKSFTLSKSNKIAIVTGRKTRGSRSEHYQNPSIQNEDPEISPIITENKIISSVNSVSTKEQESRLDTFGSLVSAIALVCGTTVGAGILALPAATKELGVIPSSLGLLASWFLMSGSGLLLAECTCRVVKGGNNLKKAGILEVVKIVFGWQGALVTGTVYIFLHYALLVAYIAGASDILNDSFSIKNTVTSPIVFTAVLGSVLALGSQTFVNAINNIFVGIVITSFLSLLFIGFPYVQGSNLFHQDYNNFVSTFPILILSLVFHNVVPSVCKQLHYDKSKIQFAIIVGSIIPLIMFLAWNTMILGITPQDTDGSDPVAILRTKSPTSSISLIISVFGGTAIVTSFVGFVIGLVDFFSDLFPRRVKGDLSMYTAVLLPPLVIALLEPDIFCGALEAAGAYGVTILFGIIPILLAGRLRQIQPTQHRKEENPCFENKSLLSPGRSCHSNDNDAELRSCHF